MTVAADPTTNATSQLTRPSKVQLAFDDIATSIRNARFWMTLAWVDILQRYRGSMIGPFWLTLSTGAMILGLGPLYALLFKLDLKTYLPYLSSGLIIWNLIVASITESCSAFIVSGAMMKQIRIPRMTHIFHLVSRNVIIFSHSIPLYFLVHFGCGLPWRWSMLWAIPGLALLIGILTAISVICATISVRFRDFIQVVASVLQISFFLTPIIWHVGDRPALRWVADINPLAAMVALIRDPLMGLPISLAHLAWTIGGFIVLSGIAFMIFARYRARIIYWV